MGVGQRTKLDFCSTLIGSGTTFLGLQDQNLVKVGLPLEVLFDEVFDSRNRRLGQSAPRNQQGQGRNRLVLEVQLPPC